jgi:membrane protein DedA with SNARE-associated domain
MIYFGFLYLYEITKSVNGWVLNLISNSGYSGCGFVMFLENILPPIPSKIILPLAESLTTNGEFSLSGITLVGLLRSAAGVWIHYGISFFIHEKRARVLIHKYRKWFLLSNSDSDRALDWFKKYGNLALFFGRTIPMARGLISVPAGLAK